MNDRTDILYRRCMNCHELLGVKARTGPVPLVDTGRVIYTDGLCESCIIAYNRRIDEWVEKQGNSPPGQK